MAGYVIAQLIRVTDEAAFEEYRSRIGATIERYGGTYVVRRAEVEVLEGDWQGRPVVIRFESVARAREWYQSPEYQPLVKLRQRAAEATLILVEGV